MYDRFSYMKEKNSGHSFFSILSRSRLSRPEKSSELSRRTLVVALIESINLSKILLSDFY